MEKFETIIADLISQGVTPQSLAKTLVIANDKGLIGGGATPPFPISDITDLQSTLDVKLSSIIELSFAQLNVLIGDDSLLEGQSYLITDYETRHRIDGTDDLNDNNTPEPIMCIASAVNDIFRQVYSPSNPFDIIFWDYTDVLCENVAQTPRTGKIVYRKDTINNVETPFDFRKVQVQRSGNKFLSIPTGCIDIVVKFCDLWKYGDIYIEDNTVTGVFIQKAFSDITFERGANRIKILDIALNCLFTSVCESLEFNAPVTGFTPNLFGISRCIFNYPVIGFSATQSYEFRTFDMQSPDGSLWANSIDDLGVVTTVKLQ